MITDEESLGAEERIKQLLESEEDKRKELEEKKQELEKKKKELLVLEKQREGEIRESRKEIENQIEELAIEEKERFEEAEEMRRRREEAEASLEATIEREEREEGIPEVPEQQRGYGEVFKEIERGNPTFYDITNYNVQNRLESIAQRVVDQSLDTRDRVFIDNTRAAIESRQGNDFYKNRDTSNYMSKALQTIDSITKSTREREEKREDYHP